MKYLSTGGCLPQFMLGYTVTPWKKRQTPFPLGSRHPPPPGADIPQVPRHPRRRHPPGADPPGARHLPRSRHPPHDFVPDSCIRSMSGRYIASYNGMHSCFIMCHKFLLCALFFANEILSHVHVCGKRVPINLRNVIPEARNREPLLILNM